VTFFFKNGEVIPMAETKKFKVNAPKGSSTAWRFGNRMVLAGQDIEVPIERIARLTEKGMIGDPIVQEVPNPVPVRRTQEIQRPLAIPSQEGNTVDPIAPSSGDYAPEPAAGAGEPAKRKGGRPRKTEVDVPVDSEG
jgi:hypothetical protein